MGTVTSNVVRINSCDGTITSVSVGGGAGATANTDIFIQGTQSAARRVSGATLNGFLFDNATTTSMTSRHMGAWVWVTHYSALTDLRLRLAGSAASTNYSEYQYQLTELSQSGGWIRIWVDVAQTPIATGGTGADLTAVRWFGPVVSLPSVGGNAQNIVLDAVDYTDNSTGGLLLTGTSSVFQNFLTADTSTTNKYGIVEQRSGTIFCYGRLTLGSSATSVSFSDSNFAIVFPQQALVSDTFMGLSIDLTNASSTVSFSGGSLSSPGTKKGDLVVSGTSGTFTMTGCTVSGLRALTLNGQCTVSNTTFLNCGQITLGNADINNCVFNGTSATSGILTSTLNNISGSSFISDGSGYAIQLTAAGTYTFSANNFSGFGADGTSNAAIYNNSGGAVTINITDGGNSPTITNGASATTTVVNAKTYTIANIIDGTEVRIFRASDSVELAGGEVIGASPSGLNGVTVSSDPDNAGRYRIVYSYGYTTDIPIFIMAVHNSYQIQRITSSLKSTDGSIQLSQTIDRQYGNPA